MKMLGVSPYFIISQMGYFLPLTFMNLERLFFWQLSEEVGHIKIGLKRLGENEIF